MLFIQLILILFGLLFLSKVLSGRSTHSVQAQKKIAIILLLILMIVAVVFPDSVTWVANLVGIGRGADLLIYILFTAFLFYVSTQYVRKQDEKDTLYRLARKLAILEAKANHKDRFVK